MEEVEDVLILLANQTGVLDRSIGEEPAKKSICDADRHKNNEKLKLD